jgi:hypothetical protein
MPESTQITFTYKEIVETLLKREGIHEGIWGIYLEYGLAAVNVNREAGSTDLTPAAIVAMQKIGISRVEEENSLTVNAAEVNPAPGAAKKGAAKKGTK